MAGGEARPGRNARRREEALRREQEALAAAQRERTRRRRAIALSGVLLVGLVFVVGGYLLVQDRRQSELEQRLAAGGCTRDTRADKTRGGGHVPAPTYSVEPPAGGDHLPEWARAGSFSAADAPGDGLLVHSLEHGYVVLWHRSGLPAPDLAALRALAQRHRGDVILVERPQLPVPVAATAWEQRLLCPGLQVDALEAFVGAHVGEGPEDVQRG